MLTMKNYLVYVNGVRQSNFIRADSHNEAKEKAETLYPGTNIRVWLFVG